MERHGARTVVLERGVREERQRQWHPVTGVADQDAVLAQRRLGRSAVRQRNARGVADTNRHRTDPEHIEQEDFVGLGDVVGRDEKLLNLAVRRRVLGEIDPEGARPALRVQAPARAAEEGIGAAEADQPARDIGVLRREPDQVTEVREPAAGAASRAPEGDAERAVLALLQHDDRGRLGNGQVDLHAVRIERRVHLDVDDQPRQDLQVRRFGQLDVEDPEREETVRDKRLVAAGDRAGRLDRHGVGGLGTVPGIDLQGPIDPSVGAHRDVEDRAERGRGADVAIDVDHGLTIGTGGDRDLGTVIHSQKCVVNELGDLHAGGVEEHVAFMKLREVRARLGVRIGDDRVGRVGRNRDGQRDSRRDAGIQSQGPRYPRIGANVERQGDTSVPLVVAKEIEVPATVTRRGRTRDRRKVSVEGQPLDHDLRGVPNPTGRVGPLVENGEKGAGSGVRVRRNAA